MTKIFGILLVFAIVILVIAIDDYISGNQGAINGIVGSAFSIIVFGGIFVHSVKRKL